MEIAKRLRGGSYLTTRVLVEAGMMIALTTILGLIKPFSLPYGGSVTAGSMIPILLLAMLRGPKIGIMAGAIYGVINYINGGWFVSPIQWALDYPLAFAGLGAAGLMWLPAFRNKFGAAGKVVLPILGVLLGIGLRFLSHFLAGIWFWGQYAPEGMHVWWYSFTYQASYLVPEMIISGILLVFLAPVLTQVIRQRG